MEKILREPRFIQSPFSHNNISRMGTVYLKDGRKLTMKFTIKKVSRGLHKTEIANECEKLFRESQPILGPLLSKIVIR